MKIHFIGIKGVSMAFLASLCESFGAQVSGSDIRMEGHDARNVHGADVVVYSYAIDENNPEIEEAKRLDLPVISRAQLLGAISRNYNKVIAVSGTHGKTTTTSMLMSALKSLNPTVHVGGSVKGVSGNIGSKEIFITEACEYRESFLSLRPDISIVLNVELDHADYYKTYAFFYDAFERFVANTKVAFVCGDNEARGLKGRERTFTFGLNEENDYYAKITGEEKGFYTFSAYYRGENLGEIALKARGKHNVVNAMAAIACCHYMGLSYDGISDFTGVDRRGESLGTIGGIEYISDYAHHPREIQCTLRLMKQIHSRVLTVFEPHTYTRTQAFYKEFASALSISDECILLPVYPARELPIKGVDSGLIAREGGFKLASSYEDAAQKIAQTERNFDAVIFMGAGTVNEFAERYVNALRLNVGEK